MNEKDCGVPGEWPRDRRRLAAAVGRLRREVRRYRRRTVVLGVALAGSLAVVVALALSAGDRLGMRSQGHAPVRLELLE